MTIKEYARTHDFNIVGKLTRRREWEETKTERWYVDEGNNEYLKDGNDIVIVTADGGVL